MNANSGIVISSERAGVFKTNHIHHVQAMHAYNAKQRKSSLAPAGELTIRPLGSQACRQRMTSGSHALTISYI